MSKLLKAGQQFLAAFLYVISTLCGASAFASGLTCSELFREAPTSTWPPRSWDGYLKKVADPDRTRPLVEPFDPVSASPPNLYDARFFQLHLNKRLFPYAKMVHEPPCPELSDPRSEFSYVGTFHRDALKSGEYFGPFGTIVVVRSEHTGRKLSIPAFPKRPPGARRLTYLAHLNAYLRFAEAQVVQDRRDPQLDYFFETIRNKDIEKNANKLYSGPRLDEQTETHVTASYDEGQTQRLTTRRTVRRGNLWLTEIDSHVRRDVLKERAAPTAEEIARGRETQRAWLTEIVKVLYPEYVDRRKWTKDFIDHDFQEVLASADRTRYLLIHEDAGGQPGPVIAAIGLNRAPYSSITRLTPEGWIRNFTAGGYRFLRDFSGAGYSDRSFKAGRLPMQYLPVLKMENYLGVHLKRPVAVDHIRWSGAVRRTDLELIFETASLQGEGVIYEPVKFYLAPGFKAAPRALTELVSAMAAAIVREEEDPRFAMTGQWLYTFNPLREGQLLYSKRGYQPDPNYQSVTKDGTEWHIFGQSPRDFLEKFHRLSPEDQETAAGQFLESLRETARRLDSTATAREN